MPDSGISWTDRTWELVEGCRECAAGCKNCYARRVTRRIAGNHARYEGLVQLTRAGRLVWTGEIRLRPDRMVEPLSWRRPSKVFVCSRSDLFHEAVPEEFLERAFVVMQRADLHWFQVLTKRVERLAEFSRTRWPVLMDRERGGRLPLHIALGTSVAWQKDIERAARVWRQVLSPTPWLSVEPLLAPVDLRPLLDTENVGWVVVGGESAERVEWARRCEPEWIQSVVDQCRAAQVPVFVKQLGMWYAARRGYREKKGEDMREWEIPSLRVREYPQGRV